MNVLYRFTPFIAIGIGVMGLIALVDNWVSSRSYDDWTSTPGEISTSKIVSGIGCGPGNTMSSMVIYDFEVDGVAYSSFNISNGADDIKCGTDMAEEYPEGKKVTVYYDPENPQDSVLRLTRMNTFFTVFIAFMLFGMILIGYAGWRIPRKKNQDE